MRVEYEHDANGCLKYYQDKDGFWFPKVKGLVHDPEYFAAFEKQRKEDLVRIQELRKKNRPKK